MWLKKVSHYPTLVDKNKSRCQLTPFRFNPEENPNEATEHLQQLHDENAPFEIVEMVQVR